MRSNYFRSGKTTFVHGDSIKMLKTDKHLEFMDGDKISCIVTGIPDADEISLEEKNYIVWLEKVVRLLFEKTKEDGYVIFMQTDRKVNKRWMDKSYHIQKVAYEKKWNLMWHKIMLYREPERSHLQRPTYGHILCFSKVGMPGKCFPDVIYGKERLYKNGTPIRPLFYVMNFLNEQNVTSIFDPFAGHFTIGRVASLFDISSVNVELYKNLFRDAKETAIENSPETSLLLKMKRDFFTN